MVSIEEKKQYKIDVIIPAYNAEKFIIRTLQSVINQTYAPTNIFVVDDGSTDQTTSLVDNFKQTSSIPIQIISKKNKGISSARNVGIRASTSLFVAFLDADDIWLPTKLEKQVEIFIKSDLKKLGLIYCAYDLINENGLPDKNGYVFHIEQNIRGKIFSKLLHSNKIASSGSGILIKKECFDAVGLFDENLKAFEDWDMWLRIAEKYEIDYSQETLVQIRRHPQNMQKDFQKMHSNELYFYSKWMPKVWYRPQIFFLWEFRIIRNRIKIKKNKSENNSLKPTISVIMPVYNGDKYLSEAIESVLNQTFNDFELIIIDDFSTDKSRSIAESFQQKDPRIKVVSNLFSKGVVGARNTGLFYSAGKYIACTDSDDIQMPNRFEIQYKYLEKHPTIFILGSGFKLFENDKVTKNLYYPSTSLEIAWLFVSDMYFCNPSTMFKKEILNESPNYPNEISEDYGFFIPTIRKYKGYNIRKTLLKYRQHPNNYSTTEKFGIKKSVRKRFEENFLYYVKSPNNADVFFQFQSQRDLSLKNLGIIFSLSFKILNKIQEDYKTNRNIAYYYTSFKIVLRIFKSITFHYIRKIINKPLK